MSRKRRNTSSPEPDNSPPAHRSFVFSQDSTHNEVEDGVDVGFYSDESATPEQEQPQIDFTSGQVGAFPGLSHNAAENSFYGPAHDGIDYLRMVRTEANALPHFITAAEYDIYTTHDRYDGFFDEDEACVAKPYLVQEPQQKLAEAQLRYYDSMIIRFRSLRERLRSSPSLERIQALPETVPISFPASSRVAKITWEAFILQYPPNPVQITSIDEDSLMELLRFMTKKMRKLIQVRDTKGIQRIGTWLWTTLAKCADRGELSSDAIADVRACAKAADLAWQWVCDGTNIVPTNEKTYATQHNDEESEYSDEATSVAGSKVAKIQDQDFTRIENPSDQTAMDDSANTKCTHGQLMILDMVITVVGEIYGQYDLLQLRRPWTWDR